jgi:UDP-N-acetylenolpyruvoylglucosamine reductase
MRNRKVLGTVLVLVVVILGLLFAYYWHHNLRCEFDSFEECVNNSGCGEGFGSDLEVTKCDCDRCYRCSAFKSENNRIFAKSVCPTFVKTPLTSPVNLNELNDESKTKLKDTISDNKKTLDVTIN